MTTFDVLKSLNFGARVAEEEVDELSKYFVETDNWNQLYSGDVDIVYGPKGSGKSALYTLLISRATELRPRSILLAPAENPRGTPAFRDLVTDPPASEIEFTSLWKLYFSTLVADTLIEQKLDDKNVRLLQDILTKDGLLTPEKDLRTRVALVRRYIGSLFKPSAVEGGIDIDPVTGFPKGFKGKIIFQPPSAEIKKQGYKTVDYLLGLANKALEDNDLIIWVLLDRLDVAFSESGNLEANALRALLRVYLDLLQFSRIKLKIFLRTDIWKRINEKGFPEASHITKHLTIEWDRNTLLNLIIRRALKNPSLIDFYDVKVDEIMKSIESQLSFFYQMCPPQIEPGTRKPSTFDWMLSRTRDGTTLNSPRELIHLLESLRKVQVRYFENGQNTPENKELFARAAYGSALAEVSRVRLNQTMYPEYPELRSLIEKLRKEKTAHTRESLSAVWKVDVETAQSSIEKLVEVGFFEARGEKSDPQYWIPFLYRDALELVQGTAE